MDFTLMTFNIFNHTGKVKKIISKLEEQDIPLPDIICTQEDNSREPPFGENYKQLISSGTGNNIVAVYYNTNTIHHSRIKGLKQVTVKNYNLKGVNIRNGVLFSIDNIIIANIHLEGGRYVDRELLKSPEATYKYMNYKLSLLKKMCDYNPQIILGDFNSVFSHKPEFYNKFLSDQYKYFASIYKNYNKGALTANQMLDIKIWNNSPYKHLYSTGYNYFEPENPEIATNSRGLTIVDTIWYNSNLKIKNYKCKIIDCGKVNNWTKLFDGISDHNPVYLKLFSAS